MSGDKNQAISVRLTGNNYSYWAHVMKNFVVGKEMWGYVDGSTLPPFDPKDPGYATALGKWNTGNAQILTWFHNSVEPSIGMNFSKYNTAKKVWDYLQALYLESNFAKRYELEMSIRNTTQNNKSIQEFYNEMTTYWDQLALMEPSDLQLLDSYVRFREELRLVQFLMALRPQFEPLRGAVLHRSPLPSVDGAVHELIAEETRFKVANLAPPSQSVFAAPFAPSGQYPTHHSPTPASHPVQFAAKPRPQILKMSVTIAIRRVIGSINALTVPSQRDEMLLSQLVLMPRISLGHHNSILALLQPWQHQPPVVHLQSLIMSNFNSFRLTWKPFEGVPPKLLP
ncbi:uncharacterized protein LOC131336404 [Rhododendron vialii]|uniref:uncharacterized protein LOC131336404 n=1 Tax=Rhododendron vialii TaxID=182163 RepID=UPI00265ED1F5|nr:uncharacterized protein LOC131336404 [Rhododendron vialii]